MENHAAASVGGGVKLFTSPLAWPWRRTLSGVTQKSRSPESGCATSVKPSRR